MEKKSDKGGRVNDAPKFRGLKLKFPTQSDAPNKSNGKYFYIQKKRGDSVKKWLEDKYYDFNSKKEIQRVKNAHFGKATEPLKAPMNDIEKIRDDVRKALAQLHSINDLSLIHI